MRILLHICCGPCAIYCINSIRKKGYVVEGFFYNPNIHPVSEYDKRKEAMVSVSEKLDLPVYFHPALFATDDFFNAIKHNEEKSKRCPLCWQLRLRHTAEFAKNQNYDAFCTTLLISPYQNHDKIKEIAKVQGDNYKIDFYYEDFRPGFRESHNLARQMNLYHQKYCGCIYSERERYKTR